MTLALDAFLLLAEVLQAEAVPGIALPVAAHRAAWLPLVEAVAELTASAGQVLAHLGKQGGQLGWIRRQFRSVEARGIGHQGSGCQGEQLHMAGRVPAPPQSTRYGPHLQLQVWAQSIEQAALAHA